MTCAAGESLYAFEGLLAQQHPPNSQHGTERFTCTMFVGGAHALAQHALTSTAFVLQSC